MNIAELTDIFSNVETAQAFLDSPEGEAFRAHVAVWVAEHVSIDDLVPEVYAEWRPLVRDSMIFVFSRLSSERLASKLVEQAHLPADTPPPLRLLALISKMPGIQKMGQVLARNAQLDPALRSALSQLENGQCDTDIETVESIIRKQLGPRLKKYRVEIEPRIFSEASVSTVVRFTWSDPATKLRERGVFKVMKPHVPEFFHEDMSLLQRLADHLAEDHGYGIKSREIGETVAEVRLLLEHELDFTREQATLREAWRTHRFTAGLRVPTPIRVLCTPALTAMSEEDGVKVTDAFRNDKVRRRRVAEQLIEALLAVPLLSREKYALFHADPHAGNILYNEQTRELVLLDWALTERLSRESRRHLTLLVIMTTMRDIAGVTEQIQALSINSEGKPAARQITDRANRFFAELPGPPGALDAMRLVDRLALEGIRFPASLAMFRKVMFTLDGVLNDVAGPEHRMDCGIVREFILRLLSSYGLYHSPLDLKDFISLERSALLFPLRAEWLPKWMRLPGLGQLSKAV